MHCLSDGFAVGGSSWFIMVFSFSSFFLTLSRCSLVIGMSRAISPFSINIALSTGAIALFARYAYASSCVLTWFFLALLYSLISAIVSLLLPAMRSMHPVSSVSGSFRQASIFHGFGRPSFSAISSLYFASAFSLAIFMLSVGGSIHPVFVISHGIAGQ